MRISVECDSVGAMFSHDIDRLLDTLTSLKWKTINQIIVDAIKTQFTSHLDDFKNLFLRLNTVNDVLNFWIKILNSEAETFKSELC